MGIGTTNPTERLSVNGTIRAKEIKVEAAPWPDYVFEPQYPLMPLADLRSYLATNKHLPNLPSADQVQANGLSLGEMNRKLLEKVEELTLYILENKKEIDEMKKQLQETRR